MQKLFVALTLVVALLGAAEARPTRTSTGPGAHSTSGTGPKGSTFNANSQVIKGPKGVKASGSASGTGFRGNTASGQGSFQGNQTSGSAQGSAQWKTKQGSGNASGQMQYNQGTVEGSADWNRTNKEGETKSGSAEGTYNKDTGGSATVTTGNGTTKTVTAPPAGTYKP